MFDPENVQPPGAKIKVVGVGGGGGNAVNTMIRSGLEGVDFVTANTDVQALRFSLAPHKLQVGKELTRGLGAGADPDIGRDAALEDRHEIQDILVGADMVFITAGMGGGTGTGGASVVAQIARELGALTVAVVTKPFAFEGKRRRKHADAGMARLRECVDTLITIPNQRLLQVASPELSMIDAFKMADEVLVNAVRGISDIINIPGMVNVDFADVKTVMSCMGQALMGVGSAVGPGRAVEAARQAICSPLLEDIDIEGATGLLVNITAGPGVTLHEINEACGVIQEAAHEDANFIFGTVIDETLGDQIRVTVIATGFPVDKEEQDGQAKAPSPIIQPFSTRLTSPGLITTPKPVARPTPSPQLYAPLTSRKPEASRMEAPKTTAPQAPLHAPAPVQAPVATAVPVTPTPVVPAAPVMHAAPMPSVPSAPSVEMTPTPVFTRQEPLVEMPAAPVVVEAIAPVLPVLDETAGQDEASELTRWTLGEMNDEDFDTSLAIPSLSARNFNPELDDELPADLAETPAGGAEMPVLASESRLEGARAIVDPSDDFAESMAEAAPAATLAETIFESGLTAAEADEANHISDDEMGDMFLMTEQPSVEDVRAGAVKDGSAEAPLENFFATTSDVFASDIDRKIDEALELAERMRSPRQAQAQDGDELDVPAFLRNGMKDLPLD